MPSMPLSGRGLGMAVALTVANWAFLSPFQLPVETSRYDVHAVEFRIGKISVLAKVFCQVD